MSTPLKLSALAAALTLAASAAQAQSFTCLSDNSVASCSQAVAGLSWSLVGNLFTISNTGAGNVSEVYFDTTGPMSVSFASGTGVVAFTTGANPGNLPSGMDADPNFSANFAFDSDPGNNNGIGSGESASFALASATMADLDSGALRVGLHVRSLVGGQSESLITTPIPEPETYALMLAGLGVMGFVLRRRRPQA